MTVQITTTRDSSLGQALMELTTSAEDQYLVVKDHAGRIKWSGVLVQLDVHVDSMSVRYELVEERIAKNVSHFEDVQRFTAESLGVL